MEAGLADLTRRIKAGKIGASGKVDQHAAAGVMRGGDDRDRLPGDVDAKIEQPLVNGGKMPGDKIGRLVADVEVHEIKAEALDLMVDRAGDDVARRKLSPRIEIRSEEHTSELQSLMRISYD